MRRTAWAVCALSLLLVAAALVLGHRNGAGLFPQNHLLSVAVCAVVGGLITAARPGNAVGWLMAACGLCFALLDATGHYALAGLPLAGPMAWPQTWLWVPANLSVAAVPAFFPSGRPSSPGWRAALWALAAVAAVMTAVSALLPGPSHQIGWGTPLPNPLAVPALAAVAPFVEPLTTALMGALFLAGAGDLVRRARRGDAGERAQLKWLAYAAGLAGLIVAGRLAAGLTDGDPRSIWPVTSAFWEVTGTFAACLLPAAAAVAVLRHGLFDIDLVINRTLVYVLLSACVFGGYVLVVTYLGAVFRAAGGLPVSVAAAGVVAVVFAPLRERLQRAVNLVMYGRRDDPYAALALLGRRLEEAAEPGAVLAAAARSVAEALRLPHVAVEVAGGPTHAYGVPSPGTVRLPLAHRGEPVGDLVLSPRPGESGLGARDRRVLADLARQTGIAVHAVRLSADLQRSRERLVAAREEERRRLRRDLHDGLGPTLAALTMRAEAVQDMVDDPDALAMLEEIMTDARTAMADVRTLVEGLRPPALDTLGLAGAIRSHAARLPGAEVGVEIDGTLPALPAAVEVAAYRIAAEALANARRHAGAGRVRVRLGMAGGGHPGVLEVEVADEGGEPYAVDAGDPASTRPGVGTASMRERAAELGGTCDIGPRPGGGTRVLARLPVQNVTRDTAPGTARDTAGNRAGNRAGNTTRDIAPGTAGGTVPDTARDTMPDTVRESGWEAGDGADPRAAG
ncbi:sensor histidine kinase [Microbispora triticiradicis]|uniref:histidine kinase n=2 Tax=Microbispora TaxID=2005 RepID=A0ABY3LU02_9ACTN|nr:MULTISPECIES: sensor histidine kinase [Microbispora]TLP58799.1 sensor histidine kinase [Microbispora fusca]TYB53876.1 sensor histidine kinase [Microbispora tritici]